MLLLIESMASDFHVLAAQADNPTADRQSRLFSATGRRCDTFVIRLSAFASIIAPHGRQPATGHRPGYSGARFAGKAYASIAVSEAIFSRSQRLAADLILPTASLDPTDLTIIGDVIATVVFRESPLASRLNRHAVA